MTYGDYKGYKSINFEVGGRNSIIILPENPLPGNPWIWRAEFLGAFDSVDMELVRRGWHLAYHQVSNMYGCPESLEMMKEFYDVAVKYYNLNRRPVIFGFSRGGLYTVNFANKYPGCVSTLYLDAPVTDIKSWPGGKGVGYGAEHEWKECLGWYKLDEESAKTFKGNPNDYAENIAKYGIPVVIVAGDSDKVVPYVENGAIFYDIFSKYSDKIQTIVKPGCDHHPHSLEDPTPVVNFIEKYAL
ncbi:MAG: alpha/beta hydrolase [Firmicutes bacterium]|nr:alpha/beta hydrolase [Bacillota bacterium]